MKKTKAKTKKIVAKRFRLTKSGKILRRRQNARHLRSKKSKKHLRRLAALDLVDKSMKKTVRKLMPYA